MRTISGFYNGEYLVWNIAGHVQIKVTNNASNGGGERRVL